MTDVSWLEALIAVLAAWRITRLITVDTFPPVAAARDRILERWPTTDETFHMTMVHPYCDSLPETTEDPAVTERTVDWPDTPPEHTTTIHGTSVWINPGETPTWSPLTDSTVGELVTCPWCAGFWVALAVVAWIVWVPVWGWILLAPFALSAAVGLIATHLD